MKHFPFFLASYAKLSLPFFFSLVGHGHCEKRPSNNTALSLISCCWCLCFSSLVSLFFRGCCLSFFALFYFSFLRFFWPCLKCLQIILSSEHLSFRLAFRDENRVQRVSFTSLTHEINGPNLYNVSTKIGGAKFCSSWV